MGGALHAVGRARVAVLEPARGQVVVGDADRAFRVERDDDFSMVVVDVGDGAGAAVLDEPAPVGVVEAAVVAAGDDFVTDHELPAGDDERFAGEFAVRFEERAGAVVEGLAGRVRARDHRIRFVPESRAAYQSATIASSDCPGGCVSGRSCRPRRSGRARPRCDRRGIRRSRVVRCGLVGGCCRPGGRAGRRDRRTGGGTRRRRRPGRAGPGRQRGGSPRPHDGRGRRAARGRGSRASTPHRPPPPSRPPRPRECRSPRSQEQSGDGGRFGAGRAGEPGRAFEFRGRGGGHRTTQDRDAARRRGRRRPLRARRSCPRRAVPRPAG